MEPQEIQVHGAREHNLQGIDVAIPKKKLVVLTGPSGSGKSSLAIDTIYTEGRRRFVQSLSAYARQFLGQKGKPKCDKIQGLSPSIAVEQKAASVNPRSTVGTITEIHDYLRVLYARLGTQHCTRCDQVVEAQSAQAIVERICALPDGTRLILLAPRIENRKGEHREELAALRGEGLVRVRLDGEIVPLEGLRALDKRKKHTLEAVVDRLVVRPDQRPRITDSVETALRLGAGRLVAYLPDQGAERIHSERLACEDCGLSFPDLSPQSFSFNSPQGLCEACNGLGHGMEMDPRRVVPDPSKSVLEGCLAVPGYGKAALEGRSWHARLLRAVAEHYGIDLDRPWKELSPRHQKILLSGSGKEKVRVRWRRGRVYPTRWEGVLPSLRRRMLNTSSERSRDAYARFQSYRPCSSCGGARLRPESRAVRVAGRGIHEVCEVSVAETARWVDSLREGLPPRELEIAGELLKEIRTRLRFLEDVGLDYLSLSRLGPSLSGGEGQRIQLASQIGSELSGVIYVLDEPSIGLHPRDASKLISTLEHLRDKGNTILVVEHDRETIERADWIVDFGPGAGRAGGQVTAAGTPAQIAGDPRSLTGRYLSGELEIPLPARRRPANLERALVVRGARANNLKGIDVSFPLGTFVCVTGVSGAGKSTLVNQILLPGLKRASTDAPVHVGEHEAIEGTAGVDKVIAIDQQPIGRTPRSNPATYVKVFDLIRDFFARLPEAQAFGFKPGRFSFNVKGGRCEACEGSGVKQIEMHFLADVFVTCAECQGRRFNEATLRVRYKGHTVADVLDLTVAEAAELFRNHPRIHRHLQTLLDVGLGYVALGQPSPTLSGGEAQRVKLARELSKRDTGRTFYVLDEPSTGLHFDDIRKLLAVLDRLVDAGNTVVVIEHNLDIVKTADWVIDLGPEGGDGGGELIAAGPPEAVAACPHSHTGRYLAPLLAGRPVPPSAPPPTRTSEASPKPKKAASTKSASQKPKKASSTKSASQKPKKASSTKSASKKPKKASSTKSASKKPKKASSTKSASKKPKKTSSTKPASKEVVAGAASAGAAHAEGRKAVRARTRAGKA
ncbi:MAG: excinuclease ABC subunit UvrA [Planctomycetota bacterium]|nr:MAG: excinuclease ABC subunit UvrA [Planctomycetota bacterium]